MNESSRRRVLHLGPFQPVLETALAAEIVRVRARDPMATVVVLCPTPLLCQHLKRNLVDRLANPRGHAGIRFVTMRDLAGTLATAAMAEQGKTALPAGAERVLWRRAVASLAPGGFFEPIRATRGFPGAVRATILDLKAAGLTPAVAERRAQGATRLERKLRELARVWRRLEESMSSAGFHDDLDLMREAAEIATQDPPFLRGAAAFLYGFHTLTRTERRLVGGFLQRPAVAAFVPWADDDEAFAACGGLRDFLQGTLELFPEGETSRPLEPMPPFDVIAAPGDAREATEVARVVAGANGPLRHTGVLMRTPSTQATTLDLALSDAGIPHYLPGELPVGHLPAARTLRLLLECRRDDMPRPAVLELVTTAPMRFGTLLGADAAGAAPGVWEALSREWGIVGGASEWRARVAAGVAELMRAVERDREGGAEEPRPGAEERVRRARGLARFVDRFDALLAAIPAEGRWSVLARTTRFAWDALFEFPPEDADPVVGALDAVAQLDALGHDDALGRGTLEEMVELLEDALSMARPAEDSFEGDGVFVADLVKSRGLPFRTVILPGMVEGLFPRAASPDPLLSDSERRHLNSALTSDESPFGGTDEQIDALDDGGGDGPIPLRGASADEERLYFRLAVDAASESVVFTLPRLDSESGRERVPSWLLLQAVERATGATRALTLEEFAHAKVVRWMPLDPAPRTRALALTRLERNLVDLRDALAGDDPVSHVARLLSRAPFARAVLASERNRWGSHRFTEHDGWIPPPDAHDEWRAAVAALAFSGREVSATRLEAWAVCPYRYFLRYALGLSALEEPERQLTLSPLDRGSLIHEALEIFWRAERDAKRLPHAEGDLAAAAGRLDAIAVALLDTFAATGVTGPRILWDATRAEILEDLRTRLHRRDSDDGWIPAAFETGFGSALPGEGEAAATGAAAVGALAFRGRIDRIDLSADGKRGRVVDYKTGLAAIRFASKKKTDEPRVFHGGEALQLPVYVLAAKLRFPEVEDWSAVYDYCTRRGEFSMAELQVPAEVLDTLEDLVTSMAADVARGRFPFLAGAHCRGCDFKDVCGPAHDIAFATKEDWEEFVPLAARKEEYR